MFSSETFCNPPKPHEFDVPVALQLSPNDATAGADWLGAAVPVTLNEVVAPLVVTDPLSVLYATTDPVLDVNVAVPLSVDVVAEVFVCVSTMWPKIVMQVGS